MSLKFLVTSIIVVLIPGSGVIYTVSTGLAQGRAIAQAGSGMNKH
jgi:threonine/homoserine/homoserine lactone efflux protein